MTDGSLALRTGTDLGFGADTNWENLFANEECAKASISLEGGSNHLKAGLSSTYRFTMSMSEANLDNGGDLFSIVFDDLGGDRATDARLNRGATASTVAFTSGT